LYLGKMQNNYEFQHRKLTAQHANTLQQMVDQMLGELSHPEVIWILAHLLRKYTAEFLKDEWKLEYLTKLMRESNVAKKPNE